MVPGFEPSECESLPITTRQGLPPYRALALQMMSCEHSSSAFTVGQFHLGPSLVVQRNLRGPLYKNVPTFGVYTSLNLSLLGKEFNGQAD